MLARLLHRFRRAANGMPARPAACIAPAQILERAEAVIASVALVRLSNALAARAAALAARPPRSLDAVHVATASVAGPLDALVGYDTRRADAARVAGLCLVQPV